MIPRWKEKGLIILLKQWNETNFLLPRFQRWLQLMLEERWGNKSDIPMHESFQRKFPDLIFWLDNACLVPQNNYSLKNKRITQSCETSHEQSVKYWIIKRWLHFRMLHFHKVFSKVYLFYRKNIRDAQVSGTELHHKLFLQRKLTESFTGLSGWYLCFQVESGVVGCWDLEVWFCSVFCVNFVVEERSNWFQIIFLE